MVITKKEDISEAMSRRRETKRLEKEGQSMQLNDEEKCLVPTYKH